MSRSYSQMKLRLPDDVRQHVIDEARRNQRSLTAEFVVQLRRGMPPQSGTPAISGEEDTEAAVIAKIRARQQLGIAKYGCAVAQSVEDELAFLQHAQDEAMDLAVYLQKRIDILRAREAT